MVPIRHWYHKSNNNNKTKQRNVLMTIVTFNLTKIKNHFLMFTNLPFI